MDKGNHINLIFISFTIILITLLLLLKIYLSNNIYLISRDIQKISSKIEALKEEQKILKLKVEKLKYKNSIADPLFNYKIKKDESKEYQDVKEESTP